MTRSPAGVCLRSRQMTVMEEENKELRERLAGLTADGDNAEGAEEGDAAAAAAADSTAAEGKEKKVLGQSHATAPWDEKRGVAGRGGTLSLKIGHSLPVALLKPACGASNVF